MLKVFVYGTLKPGEKNYSRYCAGKVVNTVRAVAQGNLFALPMGYPAMTLGERAVHGYLLSFTNPEILTALDELEDYAPNRAASENLYNRTQIQISDLQERSLSSAWVYIMTETLAVQLKGIYQPDGWWSGSK
ncbi:gamma-glutamylcyclotransferase [Brasilonema sp. UFV-L1]|uniref:gamma-glutamylcyclotransferase n=1 Tax=Brasilonema sp. UFV-L1 TaxID=2234130 RepID=UPI00145CAF76|nr:gamma-glutamylcyclotransferase [Brasilonema sp. UFV-L1]